MPLSRYQIRNEYSLADPDLYRAADKDDPEALLEGVAMAGLVGVLRQLGDLAEFAAEIFHDLHEEVMTTASRGHSLMVRVQQLEAEFPTMEKAFLSQTSHSSFFYNTGIDWHPNMRMDQNLITHGDLPRFIMDSYEECRGPPRLFHLDKFDVAGAGACLKRYTDPSVFKVETSYFGIASTDVLREKKTRKTKKKGSRWRNRETPETLPTSHAKLHQLFLEERIENGTSDSVRRVKLKRRLSGFPFDSKSGKSYMEKFLKSSSPVHDEVHEIPVDSSPLALPYNSTYESAFEIVEISTVSPEKESKQRTRSPSPFPTREGSALESAMGDLNEVPRILEESKSNPALEDYDICSTLHKVVNEKEISVDGGIKTGSSVDGYQSDDIASEIDNYVDALTTMESELDTDSELRGKDDLRYLNNLRQTSDVDANDEQVQAHSSDSVSMGNSTLSDDGNSSSKKDLSSFSYSDSHSTAENTPSDGEVSSNVFTSNEILEAEVLLTQESIDEEGQVCQPPGGAISDGAFTEPVEIPSHSSEIGDPYTSLSPSDLIPVSKNAEAVVKEIASVGPETDEMVANLPSIGYVWKQKGDCWSPKLSGEKQLLDEFDDTNKTEALGCMSYLIGPSLSEDGFPLQLSAENQLVDALEDEDLNQDEDVTSTSECLSDAQVISENSSLLSSNTQPLRKLHDEDPNLIEIPSGAYHTSDALVMNGECLSPGISAETPNDSGVEDLNLIIDASVCVSNVLESATEKEITENMPDTVPEIGHENDNLVQNSVETQISPQNSVETQTSPQNSVETQISPQNSVETQISPQNSVETQISPQNSVETQISPQNSVETQISPQNSVIPLTEDESIDPINAELDTHNSCVEPVDRFSEVNDPISSHGERSENIIFKEGTPINCDSVESCISGTTTDIPPLWSSKERTSKLREEYFDEPSKIGDGAVMDEAASDPDMFEKDTTAEPSLMPGVHVHFNNMDYESVNVPAAFAGHDDNAVDNDDDDGSSLDLKKLQEGSLSSFGNEHNGLETETCFSQELAVSYITEDVYQHKFASPDLNNLCDIVIDNDSGSQVRDEASDTYIVSGAGSMNLDNAPIIQSSAEDNEQEPEHSEEKADLLPEQIDEKLLNEGEANSELLNQLQKTHYSNHDDHVAPFYASSKSLLENIPSQPSSSELSPQGNSKIDVSEHFLYPSSSLSSGLFLLPDSSQVYVEEMPPLPPLPPVQWRMGKLQHASPAQETVLVQRNQTAFLPLLPSNVNQEARPLNPFLTPTSANEKSTPVSEQPTRNTDPFLSQVQPVVDHGDSKDNILPPEGTSTFLQKPGSESETLQNDFQAGEGEKVQLSLDSFSHASSVDGASIYALELSHKEVVKPLHQMAPETSSKDIELSQRSALSEENILTCDTTELPSKIANKHDMRTSEESLSWPPAEDGKPHGNRTTKQHRPRSPLIDAVAAHDKSKLRKVTERVRPQIQKEDERDSLLQQIRTKSFNLKPAVVTRASIQGPKTNLKVAAILEKAKTIRQALTGSDDDDDDDSWSDS